MYTIIYLPTGEFITDGNTDAKDLTPKTFLSKDEAELAILEKRLNYLESIKAWHTMMYGPNRKVKPYLFDVIEI